MMWVASDNYPSSRVCSMCTWSLTIDARPFQIAETAQKLRILVIADEVYGHLAFGDTPFVPMGRYASITPVLTLGSLSKRWIVPGWRLGWFVTTDPSGMFRKPKVVAPFLSNHYNVIILSVRVKVRIPCFLQVVERIKKYFDILGGPATFIQVTSPWFCHSFDCWPLMLPSHLTSLLIFPCQQAAVPRILEQTEESFFEKTIGILKHSSDICYSRIKEIPFLTCPQKPSGSMAMMVSELSKKRRVTETVIGCNFYQKLCNFWMIQIKINLSLLQDISDDIDFCFKLAKEEKVIILPGNKWMTWVIK